MKHFKKRSKQGGWAMAETMLAVTVSAVLVSGGLVLYSKATASNQSQSVGSAVSDMASKIQKNFAMRGSYDTLNAATVNGMGLVSSPLVWATNKVQDPWGNQMNISGNANGASATFAITLGGSTAALDKSTCVDIATQLATSADVIRVGADAAAASGLVSGGTVYKAASSNPPDPAVLATACAASPVIALQWH